MQTASPGFGWSGFMECITPGTSAPHVACEVLIQSKTPSLKPQTLNGTLKPEGQHCRASLHPAGGLRSGIHPSASRTTPSSVTGPNTFPLSEKDEPYKRPKNPFLNVLPLAIL